MCIRDSHVVDHIDTNRCNNRPENLRWVTRLENALNNPITRRKIELICGSIDNFLNDPTCIRSGSGNQSIEWMRRVSKEEADNCRNNLTKWAESGQVPSGKGKLGEWIYNGLSPTSLEVSMVLHNTEEYRSWLNEWRVGKKDSDWDRPKPERAFYESKQFKEMEDRIKKERGEDYWAVELFKKMFY